MPTDTNALLKRAAHQLLSELGELAEKPKMRVAHAEGGLACLIQVWRASEAMPTAGAERRRQTSGGRAECKRDVVEVVRAAGRPLTRKEVLKELRAANKSHGAGTVAKALAELARTVELVNPKDKKGYRLPEWPRRKKTPTLF